jgi:FkbM family methyltransferase
MGETENVRDMTERHDRHFYTPDTEKMGLVSPIDYEKRWIETGGDHNGEIAYQYFEMFHCPYHTDTDCDYERQGCLLQKGDVVVDVGGNIGVFARRAWERGASKIVSFEPQRKTFVCFLKNSKPEMEAYNLAISDKIGICEITSGGSRFTGGGSIVDYGIKEQEFFSERAITMSLDSLFENGILTKVDFLKIDVEGAEGLVLKGISDTNLKKFRCVSMEIHRNIIDDDARNGIAERMTSLGFLHFAMFYGGALATYNFWKNDI